MIFKPVMWKVILFRIITFPFIILGIMAYVLSPDKVFGLLLAGCVLIGDIITNVFKIRTTYSEIELDSEGIVIFSKFKGGSRTKIFFCDITGMELIRNFLPGASSFDGIQLLGKNGKTLPQIYVGHFESDDFLKLKEELERRINWSSINKKIYETSDRL